jgi:hypothetical protein
MGTNPQPGSSQSGQEGRSGTGSQQGSQSSAGRRVGQRIEEAVELIEMELRHAVAYVNENVVPQVRRESIAAMRSVADTLRNLADRMDNATGKGPQG